MHLNQEIDLEEVRILKYSYLFNFAKVLHFSHCRGHGHHIIGLVHVALDKN